MEEVQSKPKTTFVPDQTLIARALEGKKNKKPTRKLIFLTGFKNTGKNEFADILKKISTEPVVQIAFADALKDEFYPSIGMTEVSHVNETRELKESVRSKIIEYGESQKQTNGMYHWVSKALDSLLTAKYEKESQTPHIIITDCRRVEEMMWFKHFKLGHFIELSAARNIYEPIMFVIHREGANLEDKDYLTHIALEYAAETRTFNKMIRNYGSLSELENKIKDIYAIDIR